MKAHVHKVFASKGDLVVNSKSNSPTKLIGGPGIIGRKQPAIPTIIQIKPRVIRIMSIKRDFDRY